MGIEYIEYRTGLFELNSGSTIRQGRGRGGEMEGGGGGVDRNKLWFIKNQRDTDFLYFTTECERSEKCSKVAPELRRMQTLTVPSSNNLL